MMHHVRTKRCGDLRQNNSKISCKNTADGLLESVVTDLRLPVERIFAMLTYRTLLWRTLIFPELTCEAPI